MKKLIMLLGICSGYALAYNVTIDNNTKYPFEVKIHYYAPLVDSTKSLNIAPGKKETEDYAAYCITKIEAALLRRDNKFPMARKTLKPEYTGSGVACKDITVVLESTGEFDFAMHEK